MQLSIWAIKSAPAGALALGREWRGLTIRSLRAPSPSLMAMGPSARCLSREVAKLSGSGQLGKAHLLCLSPGHSLICSGAQQERGYNALSPYSTCPSRLGQLCARGRAEHEARGADP